MNKYFIIQLSQMSLSCRTNLVFVTGLNA